MIGSVELSILFFAAIMSGVPLFWIPLKNELFQKLLLSFSGAFILALCLFHLLPEVYAGLEAEVAGLFLFAGFLLQQVLDYFSGGIEHGHTHHNHEHHHKHSHPFPTLMLVGLCIHAFVEGVPLLHTSSGHSLFKGILLHNIPISIAFVNILLGQGIPKRQILAALILFAAMTPIGAITASFLPVQLESIGPYSLALVIGIFFHISTTILFESDQNHRFNLIKFASVILGAALAFALH
jgi:zinc and cadmium transporter